MMEYTEMGLDVLEIVLPEYGIKTEVVNPLYRFRYPCGDQGHVDFTMPLDIMKVNAQGIRDICEMVERRGVATAQQVYARMLEVEAGR